MGYLHTLIQSTERTQQVNRQLNQRQFDNSTAAPHSDDTDDIALEAEEEIEEDQSYPGAHNPRQRSTIVVEHGRGFNTGEEDEDEEEEELVDEELIESDTYEDDEAFEDEEEGSIRQGDDLEEAEYIRLSQEYYNQHDYSPPGADEHIMALDGDEAVPINGDSSPNLHPNQQQQQQQQQQAQQQHQQPGIVASQLAPGQDGDIVSLTSSDGQILTFQPGHQHYDQALQLHHNTQAAIQQHSLLQQQAEPPISVEDGE